jgi:hypothetical protein
VNIDNSRPDASPGTPLVNQCRSMESSQIWSTPELQFPFHHRRILCVACHPEHSNITVGVAPNDCRLRSNSQNSNSQVGSPRSVGSATLRRDEHCRNTAQCLHAIIKIKFDLTDHLSGSRYYGGDRVPTCAPSDRPDQHNQPVMEHDPLAPQPM